VQQTTRDLKTANSGIAFVNQHTQSPAFTGKIHAKYWKCSNLSFP